MYKPSHSTIQSEKLSFDSIATRRSLNSKHLRRKLPTSFLCEVSVQRIALGWFCTTTFGSIWICKAKQTTPESSSLKFKHRPYKVDATATSDPQKSKEHHAFGLKFLKVWHMEKYVGFWKAIQLACCYYPKHHPNTTNSNKLSIWLLGIWN